MQDNPLFGTAGAGLDQDALNRAAEQDRREVDEFMSALRQLVQEAVDLPTEVDSETVVNLKERLEKSYSRCVSLAGEQRPVLRAIENLIGQMAAALRKAAGDDPVAQQHLDDEEVARQRFIELHSYPIVADIMRSDSAILPEELLATLLSEDAAALEAALCLFTTAQLVGLSAQARTLLESLAKQGHNLADAWGKLGLIEGALLNSPQDSPPS